MYFPVAETTRLAHLIQPYIIPSMRYKIGYPNNPVTTEFAFLK